MDDSSGGGAPTEQLLQAAAEASGGRGAVVTGAQVHKTTIRWMQHSCTSDYLDELNSLMS